MEKEVRIFIRIQKDRKESWKKICSKKGISLSSLIISSVENKLLDDERKKVLDFIEKQDNLFVKIETNINQVAKIANTQQFISKTVFEEFKEQLVILIKLKEKQNEIFLKIYSLIANDY